MKDLEDRKKRIEKVFNVLGNIKIQCPQSHAGLVVAYEGCNLAPVINADIKFSWYRMKFDKMEQVQESFCSWYSPTVDDIGCTICAQCEDNFAQGCSRYLECGMLLYLRLPK